MKHDNVIALIRDTSNESQRSSVGFVPTREAEPTDAIPGTLAKVDILRFRVENGMPLWHPDDRIFIGEEEEQERLEKVGGRTDWNL